MSGTRKLYSGQILSSLGLKSDAALDRHLDDDGTFSTPIDKHGLGSVTPTELRDIAAGNPIAATDPGSPIATGGTGTGAISLTSVGTASLQNFDTLVATGTSNVLPNGWYLQETGTSAAANGSYTAGTGSSNAGDAYSFGTAGAPTDRALGSLSSGTNTPSYGAQFTNNTGSSIGSLAIAYTGEEYRLGTAGRADRLDFQISFDATSLTTGTWTDVNQLDYSTTDTAGTTGTARDGNSAAERTAISYTLALANAVASGATFWIRWIDSTATGSNDGLAIDDFSITPIAAAPALPTLTIDDITHDEGNAGTTSYTFTVNLSAASASNVFVDYATADGTATAGSDYTAVGGTLTFAPGETTKTITVLVNGDTVFEPNETFFVNLTAPTNATIVDAQGLGTITNDDSSVVPIVSADSLSVAEGNAGTSNLTFTVSLNQVSTDTVTVQYNTADGTATTANGDYVATTGTVTFLPGETSHTVNVTINGDTAFEANETLALTLSAPTNATVGTSGTGTITNDDIAPTLGISAATVVEGNSGTTTLSYTVTLTGSTNLTTTVNYATANGTATAGTDYTATNGTLTFAPGETSKTINVTVNGDTTYEANETVLVNLTAPTNATITTAQGTGTITNDDPVPPLANIWVNELHYDNSSTDVGEAIEIAGKAGTDLTGYTIVLYNGGTTAAQALAAVPYGTPKVLSGVIDDEGGSGYGALSFSYPQDGLQNGAPDAIALIAPDGVTVVQFISYEGVLTAASGPAAGMTSVDIGVSEDGSGAAGLSLQLTGNGAAGADFTWQPDSTSSFGSLNVGQTIIADNATGQVYVSDTSVVEGNSGTSNMVFTVHRAGGLGSAATVDYVINLDGTATADDLGVGAVLNGTVTFAVGAYTATVTIPIHGDTVGEPNETLSLMLSNPVGNIAITDGSATGTIVNDDFVALTIAQIQGAGHTSSYVNQPVETTGIVTAVDTNGFYMQMAVGDGDANTSDAIFVFTVSTPTVVVGNGVTVGGTVTEFAGDALGLTVTEIANPTVTVTSAVNALPAAVLIGNVPGGILPPSQNLDDDHLTVYDPVHDGLDFWESLEGMRVTLDAPQAVSITNSFGETDVVVSHGSGATGVNDRGGITISPNGDGTDDYNPEKIQIDNDSGIFAGFNPAYTIGDQLSSVTGIVNYAFDYFEVIVTAAVTITKDVQLQRENTTVQSNADYLTLATYNLENLDASDNKYTILASDMVYNLHAPDIIAVQEVQDADGAGSGTDLSGVSNAQGIIDAILAISGLHYGYIEIAPTTTNTSGGEPGGNIRNGYFYNLDRVTYVANSAELIQDPAYNGSRKPLVATWSFQGQNITTVDVHSTSRGGSDPLQGLDQPADAAGDSQRTAQAAAVGAYVNAKLAVDPNLNIAVLGDWNGFYFEQAQTQLTNHATGGMLTNVNYLLTPEERYSYVFEGNSQQIDNILVSDHLLAMVGGYDAVHLNAEFDGTRPTDHDPQVVAFKFANTTGGESFFGTDDDNSYIVDSLNDRVYENVNAGNDTIIASLDYDLNTQPNVENLTFSGSAGYEGTGTSGNNVFTGGSGNDRFFGGGGTDTFAGGLGDDVYIVDSADDVVIELAGQGEDLIKSSVSYTLAEGSSIESLRLTGTNNNIATGNSSYNKLVGNMGDNTLDGGGGGDVLRGGLGNDTYIIRDASDVIVEVDGNGTNDLAKAAVSYVLGADAWVEALTTIDDNATTAIDLTGNAHTLILVGNEGVNHLTGGVGDETLLGLGGADIFVFAGTGVGHDTVGDFVSGTDKLDLDAYFADFAAFSAATTDVAGSAVIDLGGGQTVTINGVLEAQIQSGDVFTAANPSGAALGGAAALTTQSGGFASFGDPSLIAYGAIGNGTLGHGLFADYYGAAAMPMSHYLV